MGNSKSLNLVRWAVVVQILLATGLLAIGESGWLVFVLSCAAISVSLIVVDWKERFYLRQGSADLLALLVMVTTILVAMRADRQGLLVLTANLQSYLQYVLLFQKKTNRVLWQLSLLSLGQIAIGSTLVPGPLFGVVLLAYFCFGVFAFSLLLMDWQGRQTSDDQAALNRSKSDPRPESTATPDLTASQIVLQGHHTRVELAVLCRGLALATVAIAAFSTLVSAVIFFSLPRWNTSNFEISSSEPLRTVGFTETVILGELGEVIENPDLVMRIQFFRGRGNRPLKLTNEPLLRGAVLTRYRNRQWSQPLPQHPIMLSKDASGTITRQVITMQPLDTSEVFYVTPAVSIDESDQHLRIDPASETLSRSDESRVRASEFDIGTTGIRGYSQRMVWACREPLRRSQIRNLLTPFTLSGSERNFDEFLEEDEETFPRITALAAQILAEEEIDATQDPLAAAQALSSYFSRSGEFIYSIQPQQRTAGLDPLEDFVSDHPAGHCEYFAGALVLMLRSVGIPARMVVGFKGGEWNDLGSYYQVQQLHAHAWVEAYLTESHVPADEFDGELVPQNAWLVLDPTEGTREGGALEDRSIVMQIRQLMDYTRVLWINYVASFNSKRQRQGLYEPLVAGTEAAVDNLFGAEAWNRRIANVKESRLGEFWMWYRRHWFSWRGGLVAVGFSTLLAALLVALRALFRWLTKRGWLGKSKQHEAAHVLEMYRRLETALGQIGIARQGSQTAREFAQQAEAALIQNQNHRPLAMLPAQVVAAFYQVRFGGSPLDKSQTESVERALGELERGLATH